MDKNEPVHAKKRTPFVLIGIGCLALVILLSLGSFLISRFLARKLATNSIEKLIESKTGVKTNISDSGNGGMTFTDPKTGANVSIGSNSLPDTFPKDFPIYPKSTITSSLAGEAAGNTGGFWVTLESYDSVETVSSFYSDAFKSSGWIVESAKTLTKNIANFSLSKGIWKASVSLAKNPANDKTQIIIILSEKE